MTQGLGGATLERFAFSDGRVEAEEPKTILPTRRKHAATV
jgi:hypothetical protein